MSFPGQIKSKKNIRLRNSSKKDLGFWGRALSFCSWKIRRAKRRKIQITQKSLGDFLQEYNIASKRSLGTSYQRRKHWISFLAFMLSLFKKLVLFCAKTTFRLTVTFLVFIFVGGMIPTILSAPRSHTVTTRTEWEQGTRENIATDSATDAIQLEPEGTWESRVWTPAPNTIGLGSSSAMAENYLYTTRGYSAKDFWRFSGENNQWEVLNDLPLPSHTGADLAYLPAENAIFATFGGYSTSFYKYDLTEEDWSQMENLPDGCLNGGNLESNGTDLFYLKGNASTDFYRYNTSVETNHWEPLSGPPATISTGGGMVYDPVGDYIYVIRGTNSATFYRYKVSGVGAGNWSTMANIQVGATNYTINGETKGTYWTDGTVRYIYLFRSTNTNTLLRYQINCNDGSDETCDGEKNTWTLVTESGYGAPGTTNYSSLNYNSYDGYIYAIRGNGTQDLWKLNPAGTTDQLWVGVKLVQDTAGTLRAVNTGADLIYNGNYGGTHYVYSLNPVSAVGYLNRYDVNANAWSNTGLSNIAATINTDVSGTFDKDHGYIFYPAGTTNRIRRSLNGGAWTDFLPTGLPNTGHGTSLAYISSSSTLYVLQGNGTSGFFACDVNLTSCSSAGAMNVDGVDYRANIGAKLVSPGTYGSGTELYATLGNGETTFLKYSGGAWIVVADTPFSQYYGVSLTAYNGKIYALSGFYRDETWEYNPTEGALGTWRMLPRNQKYSYGRGPYNGASIEYAGGTSLFATTGLGLSDVWKYSVSTTNYKASGIYESQPINLDYVDSNITFDIDESKPANTEITYESVMSDDGITWDDYAEISISDSAGTITPDDYHKYIKIRITLESTDANKTYTPTIRNFTISYNSNSNKPTNPSSVNGNSTETDGVALTNGGAQNYAHTHPYFFWSGATHNGSGIAGYYVCFETEAVCTDPETQGTFQTGNTYTVNAVLKTGTYHLKIKTKDNNGNVADTVLDAFTYNYSGVSVPAENESLNLEKTTAADFNLGTLSSVNAFGSEDAGSMRLNSTNGFWNETRLSLAPAGINNGGELALANCKKTGEIGIEDDKKCLYTIAGNNTLPFYRYEIYNGTVGDVWTSPNLQNVPMNATAGSALTQGPNNTLYATRGVSTTATANYRALWTYDITSDTWTVLPNTPRDFNYGSSLLYVGGTHIYAIPGADDAFYRYNTDTGNWTGLASIQFGNPNTVNGQFTREGSDSVYDGRNNIYVTQGNQFAYFSRYSIATDTTRGEVANTWTPMRSAPVGFYYSGSLIYDSETDAIYAITGNAAGSNNSRQYFLKYDIATNNWSTLPDAPAVMNGYGGSLEIYDGYIYLTRGGGSRNFYRFNIAENSWEMPQRGFFNQSIPMGNVTGQLGYRNFANGAFIVSGDDDNVYLTRGYYDDLFGKYDTTSGEFTTLTNLPVGAYNGSSLLYNEDESALYYNPGAISTVRTGYNNYLFRYATATNSWEELPDNPNAQTGIGSTMVYDGTRYIYLTRGANSTTWWRYDTCNGQVTCTPSWSGNLYTGTSNWLQATGAQMVYKDGMIYSLRGGGNATTGLYFFACDVANAPFPTAATCWSALPSLPAGAVVSNGGSLVDGQDGYLYAIIGNNLNLFYRYNIAVPGWEQIISIPANVTTGGSGSFQRYHAWTTSGAGTDTFSDGLYSYLVGSTSNGIGFEKNGSYESDTLDLLSVYDWANLTVVYDLPDPGTTFLDIETRSSNDGEDWSDWQDASNDHVEEGAIGEPDTHTLSINSPVNPYLQVRFNFTSSDQILSPRVDSLRVYYYQDLERPNNPTEAKAYDLADELTRTEINNPDGNSWFNHPAPHFEWPQAGDLGGAFDNPNPGGSGIASYYVYFGENQNGEPTTLQTENSYTASGMTTGKTYYLRIQAIDNAGLPATDIFNAFTYSFDSVAPSNPTDITAIPLTYTAIDNFQFIWEADASDPLPGSGLDKLQYCTGECAVDDPLLWYDIADPTAVNITIPNAQHPEGAYQAAKNTFKLRAMDNAGNYSTSITQDYYFSASAPTPPETLTVSPEGVVTENEFTFTWGRPLSFTGDPTKLKYYYSINTLPNSHNVIETTAQSAGPGPFATQFGANRFYVVAKDESENIDYTLYAYVDFHAETVAPGPPLNAQAFDTSDRESAEYSVAVKWSLPTSYDVGNFAGYAIFRSEDNLDFEEIAMTTGTAFVDTALESKLYYYYVKSKDKTNIYSIETSTVSLTPTGRYTTPPTLVGVPKVTVQSFAASFTWATNRVASSFVEFGESVSLGETNGQVDSVTDHAVDIQGLSAGKKHFYRVKYIDPDGNIGTSDILNFTTLPPPTISEVLITDVVLKEATVSWKTNISATCTLAYGAGTVEETSGGSSHVERIAGLSADSTYTINIDCIDTDLNEFSSDEYTFITPKQPSASDVTVENEDNVDLPTLLARYNTNVPTSTLIYFKHNEEGSPHTYLVSDKVTEHEARIEGLDPAKEYILSIAGTDENGIDIMPIEQRITTKSDSRPPKIIVNRSLGKVLGRGNNSQANVYIKIETDEETSVKIKYAKGVVTSTLEQTASSEALNTYHLITIPAEPGQVYSYEAETYDAVGNQTKSEITSVIVEKAKASATEVITGTFAERFGWVSKIWAK